MKRETYSGGIVNTVIGAITRNLKRSNKDADKNNTVRAKINAEATATDDALNLTTSALNGAMKQVRRKTGDLTSEGIKASLEAAAAAPLTKS